MKRFGIGASGMGIVVAIIVLVVAGGAAYYFLSDVGKTKMDQAYEQFAKWTPENIAKDPKGYLAFCEAQAKQAKGKLKAAEIRVAQHEAKIKSRLEEANQKINAGQPVLTDLKAAYTTAAEADPPAFPVTYKDKEFDQPALKKQIVSLHREIKGQEELAAACESGLKTLGQQKTKIAEQRVACDEQLRLIDVNRSKLEIQEITDDLKEQLVSMRGVLETAVAVSTDTSADTFSLDQITADADATVDEAEFEAILNE